MSPQRCYCKYPSALLANTFKPSLLSSRARLVVTKARVKLLFKSRLQPDGDKYVVKVSRNVPSRGFLVENFWVAYYFDVEIPGLGICDKLWHRIYVAKN
jgi:hypothetical protein